jgi:DNA-binding LacI/PurR family transcriptional regulator
MTTNMNEHNRPTIGFLSANIHIGASRVLWPGVLDAAQTGDANLICFPGGRLDAAEPAEAMRNLIYQQIDTEKLGGLVVWTSALAGVVTPQEIVDFQQAYHTIPTVDLAASTGFGPNVSIDGNQGMRDLLLHLIEEHGCQRIALIRGPEGHPYAVERHQAFMKTLQSKGLVSELIGASSGRFRTTLVGMLQQGVLDGDETSAWQNTISIIRSALLPTLTDSQQDRAEAYTQNGNPEVCHLHIHEGGHVYHSPASLAWFASRL